MIHVDTTPTVPSTFALSFLFSIQDKKDYLQNRIIFKISRTTFSYKAVQPYFEDNKSA